jgi:ADP-heptose:LPS heptosyltransferase
MKTRSWVRGMPLRSGDFPAGTPLNHFFAWNEKAWLRDRRYVIACDLYRLLTALGNDADAQAKAVAHLALQPVIIARRGQRLLIPNEALPMAQTHNGKIRGRAVIAARQTVKRLIASIGSSDIDTHTALFTAFEQLSGDIDLDALARRRPKVRPSPRRPSPRRILIIRLSALGDFIQALGPAAAIRRHHRGDHITLLTTVALAEFAERLGFFDEVMIDQRPGPLDVMGWLALRCALRQGCFDRVYDLQTSERSAVYAQLFRPGPIPEWSGIARRCSHPHANLDRDRQHTIDKQAEQLLMAGIHPTSLPILPPLDYELPQSLVERQFVLLVPGSSARHPAKRWQAQRYGMLAEALRRAGYASVVIGSSAERALGSAIREVCAEAIDLAGRTNLEAVAGLAQRALLTVGNDTGVTHLAAAAGCPVIVLFSGASDPAWCAPRGRMVRLLTVPNLNDLEVDQVLAEAVGVIEDRLPTEVSMPREAAVEASASGAWG